MYWPRVQGCEKPSKGEPLGLEDVQGAFLIFSILLILFCLSFTAENLLHKWCYHDKIMDRRNRCSEFTNLP